MNSNWDVKGLSPFDVIVWTCTAVFVVTAAATCASLVGAPTIRVGYENLVYTALVLQLFGVGVAAFARALGVKPPALPKAPTPSEPTKFPEAEAHQKGDIVEGPPPPSTKKRKSRAARALAVSSLLLVFATGLGLSWTVFFVKPTILASKLAFRDDCKVDADAIVVGDASIVIPEECTRALFEVSQIAPDARIALLQSKNAVGTKDPPPAPPGQAGQAGVFPGGAGENGANGQAGGEGRAGSKGLDLDVIVKQLYGSLSITTSGGSGGGGGAGGNGGRGGNGAQGTPSVTSSHDSGHCDTWAGQGGRGGDGGAGGNGGEGGAGGAGGRVTVHVVQRFGDKARIEVDNQGAPGGLGGNSGAGGAGGAGGPEGATSTGCPRPVPRAVIAGKNGPAGLGGQPGRAGADGEVLVVLPNRTEHARGRLMLP